MTEIWGSLTDILRYFGIFDGYFRQVFVTPSDSLAVLAAHVGTAVPWFSRQGGVRAIARSMPVLNFD
eukprot:COSAG04_NODE_564_length_12565_cov_220.319028_11_plen_67_part_00